MRYTLIGLLLCFTAGINAQITGGPMIGYVEFMEAALWVEVAPTLSDIEVELTNDSTGEKTTYSFPVVESTFNYVPVTMRLMELDMNTAYTATIRVTPANLDAPEDERTLHFTTKRIWEYRTDPKEFSFLLGSCAYKNDPAHDRPGKPYGQGQKIYQTMAATPTDFMIWGGDNFYYRHHDVTSESGMRYRWHHSRSQDSLQELYASRPHYATWDDHDYGPNNADRSFLHKDLALQLFKEYWPAVHYGHDGDPGVYQQFVWEDCAFWMLDDRYHRAHHRLQDSTSTLVGNKQLAWLKESLLFSRAPFKFVVIGSEVLNPIGQHEGWHEYPEELEELLAFIAEKEITNVFFLTGDRHFTQINELDKDGIRIVDITCSPMSSRPYYNVADREADNPRRKEGTLVTENNFMKMTVGGKRNERVLTIECFDHDGELLFDVEYESQRIDR